MNYPTPNGSRRACCLRTGGAICFFAFLFALALGLILGAVFSETLLPALAALIVFAAIMLVAVIVLLVYWRNRGD